MTHRPGCESPSQQRRVAGRFFHFSDRIVRALHLFDIFIWECVFPSISVTTGHGVPCWVGPATEQNPPETTSVPFKPSENLIYVLGAYFSWVNLRSAFRADIFANPGEKRDDCKRQQRTPPLSICMSKLEEGPVVGRVCRSSAVCLSVQVETPRPLLHCVAIRLRNLLNSWRLDLFSKVCAQREPLGSYKL